MVSSESEIHSSTGWHPVMPAPFVKDAFLLPLYTFSSLVKNPEKPRKNNQTGKGNSSRIENWNGGNEENTNREAAGYEKPR